MAGRTRYRPVSVRELLTELQTTSALIVDLAYSSVLFNDRELAREVMRMQRKVEGLTTDLLMSTAMAVRGAARAQELIGIMRMGIVADEISTAAQGIARIVLLGLNIDPYILAALSRIQRRLVRTTIAQGSVLAGKTLDTLKPRTSTRFNVIAIRRGEKLIINPVSETTLKEKDVLIARGSNAGVSELEQLVGVEARVQELGGVTQMDQEHIVNMIVRFKDTSETMIDLAYSSLFCDNAEIADHVLEMEKNMHRLLIPEFELAVLELKERNPRSIMSLLRLGVSAEAIADAAAKIVDITKKSTAHPILRMAMESAGQTIACFVVVGESAMIGKTLGSIRLNDDIDMRVISMRKNQAWTYDPPDSFMISAGDVIVARGRVEGRDKLLKLAGPKHIHN